MNNCLNAVRAFHERFGFGVNRSLERSPQLEMLGLYLKGKAESLAATARGDMGQVRASLIVEEVGELLEALAEGDELATLDALADLAYVTVGTAVTFGLPLAEAFEEVHNSNMTKTLKQDRPQHPGKGEGYRPPDLEKVLKRSKR